MSPITRYLKRRATRRKARRAAAEHVCRTWPA
jgi:hypothetical protein